MSRYKELDTIKVALEQRNKDVLERELTNYRERLSITTKKEKKKYYNKLIYLIESALSEI